MHSFERLFECNVNHHSTVNSKLKFNSKAVKSPSALRNRLKRVVLAPLNIVFTDRNGLVLKRLWRLGSWQSMRPSRRRGMYNILGELIATKWLSGGVETGFVNSVAVYWITLLPYRAHM